MGRARTGAAPGLARTARPRRNGRHTRTDCATAALADAFDEGESRIQEGVRTGVRYGRESQLAAEGAMTLLYRWSRRTMAELIRAGREWEEETSLPNRRRRVPLDDEGS